jgi:hypothetical protein
MKTRLHHRIISFGSCFLLTSALGYPVYAAPSKDQIDNHARANGFPRSDYPYYEPVNQCGGEGVTSKVPDKYELKVLGRVVFRADFREACNNHDRCYMTAGSNRRECDANFERDLKSRCGSVAKNPGCHAFAKPYAEVVYNVGGEFFPNAQAKARNYKSLVENFITSSRPPTIGERFDKPGNNGSVSCATFCGAVNANRQPVWGDKVGVNVGSNQPVGSAGVCKCAQSPDFFIKKGNNGTVSCNTFCSGSQWGQVGKCVASFDNKNGTGQDGNYLPGFLNGLELTCTCVK